MSDVKETVEKPQEDSKVIPLAEISKHNTVDDLWMAINGKVYDVTSFVDQHPGGDEVLLEYAGRDATTAFEDVGHSENAQEMLADLYVGEGNREELKFSAAKKPEVSGANSKSSSKSFYIWCIIVAIATYYYMKATK
ncbi:Cyb5 protein [Starmerella bacillaris]|uniref:Cyb5 protein n=1 Tax=Starmerella bacillaris TaxID=1247836 RepID=A0AAV5RKQ0_STABA|nr:Cyb5 protein [Starmerella bacillaris]